MRLPRTAPTFSAPGSPGRARSRRGAALMMALLVLFILVLIVGQISIGTSTDYRTARNEVQLSTFDLAIESALLKSFEDLKDDLVQESQQQQQNGLPGTDQVDNSGTQGMSQLPGFSDIVGNAMSGGSGGRVDSRRDLWAQPQRTSEFSPIELRVLIVPENSKYNVLTMLSEDPAEAQKAYDRVVRIIDMFREGTSEDIENYDAQELASLMRDYLQRRGSSTVPRPDLSTYDEDDSDVYLPVSMREFLAIDLFKPEYFRDYRDDNGLVVHSLASFLTVNSAVWTRQEMLQARDAEAGDDTSLEDQAGDLAKQSTGNANGSGGETSTVGFGGGSSGGTTTATSGGQLIQNGGQGGQSGRGGQNGGGSSNGRPDQAASTLLPGAVNLNVAPAAVLKALFEDRDVPPQFWDEVIAYRNEEPEEEPGASTSYEEEEEPMLDEFGEPIPENQIFESPNTINQIEGWDGLEPIVRTDLKRHVTVSSDVFTIYVTAWISTSADQDVASSREEQERMEQSLGNLRRTVACTVWRRGEGEDAEIVPLVRWEVLDYMPYEILDYPEEGR
ncbi:MAG: hypothetical protein R3F34_08405 [Planctomycetota bacterium]